MMRQKLRGGPFCHGGGDKANLRRERQLEGIEKAKKDKAREGRKPVIGVVEVKRLRGAEEPGPAAIVRQPGPDGPAPAGSLAHRSSRPWSMRNRVFHRCSIGGMAFEGIVSADGPCLSCDTGGVALGVSGLRQFQPTRSLRHCPAFGWWVVKYRDEERVALAGFGHRAVRDLSDEFGLVILTEDAPYATDRVRQDYFFTSLAWDALRRWVARHPRVAKAHAACDAYLPGWHGRARTEAQALSARPLPLRN